MKIKFILLALAATIAFTNSNAQNTFPANGNVGVGTLAPATSLQVIGTSRFGAAASYGAFDATGNLSFTGGSSYRVGDNQYAFRSATYPNLGLYFNAASVRYEFRSNLGTPLFNIAATTGLVGVRGTTNASYALNVNASSLYSGINVTDPVNNYAFYSVKTGNNPSVYVENSNTLATGAVLKAVSKSNTHAIEGTSGEAGVGVYGNSVNGAGVYGSDASAGNGVTGYSFTGYGVSGSTSEGISGVYGGHNNEGIGVYGRSTSGTGVYGYSTGTSLTGGYAGEFTSTNYRGIYVSSGTGWYAGYFSGDVYATGVFQSSDAKLKKNIKDFGNAMDIINRLQPKNYEFRNDGNFAKMNLPQGTHYGLIAQDLEKVLPGLVKSENFDTKDAVTPDKREAGKKTSGESIEVKAVNYTELIPVMIKAMQEQDKTIQDQNAKIEALTQLVNKITGTTNVITTSENTNAVASVVLTNAALDQNIPNPFTSTTKINYTLPQKYHTAQIIITDKGGRTLKQVSLSGTGKGSLNIDAAAMPSGAYSYTLIADGKIVGSKQMIVAK